MKVINIEVLHDIGDIVYCRTDTRQDPMQVISYLVKKGYVLYDCCKVDQMRTFNGFELSTERDEVLLRNTIANS